MIDNIKMEQFLNKHSNDYEYSMHLNYANDCGSLKYRRKKNITDAVIIHKAEFDTKKIVVEIPHHMKKAIDNQ